jgi:hypothetical protein
MLARITFGLVTCVWLATTGAIVEAQESYALLNELYGRGVHAYFDNQYHEALESFDTAIASGSRDPRCYYYRGLTLIRLGRGDEAEQDFQMGATLEFSSEGTYDVARALERIQGAERLRLEQARRMARLAAMRQPRRVRRSPDSMSTSPETADTGRPEAPVQPARAEEPVPPAEPDPNDPFAGDTMAPIGAENVEPVEPPGDQNGTPQTVADSPDSVDDPFGAADATGQMPEAAEDASASSPFGDSAAAPAADDSSGRGEALRSFFDAVTNAIPGVGGADEGQTPATDAADPFGGPAEQSAPADAADPFGGPAEQPAPADAADPFGDLTEPEADPFGAPAAQQPPAAAPADAGAEGGGDPADPFAAPANDPFGAPAANQPDGGSAPAAPPAAADQADPFADLGGSDADPFGEAPGGEAANPPAPGEAANPPTADGGNADEQNDPFADDAAADPF